MYKCVYECVCVCVCSCGCVCVYVCLCVCVSMVSKYIHVSVALVSLNNAVCVFLLVQLCSVVFVRGFIYWSNEIFTFPLIIADYGILSHNGSQFSTGDKDNDHAQYTNYAKQRQAPWWYGGSTDAILTTPYIEAWADIAEIGIKWTYDQHSGLAKYAVMLIRPNWLRFARVQNASIETF